MRQGTTETAARHRTLLRRTVAVETPQCTRAEMDEMLDKAIEKFKNSQGEARLQAREKMDKMLDLMANGPQYTIEELNERIREAEEYFETGGKGVPNEQVMTELDEFVDLLCS